MMNLVKNKCIKTIIFGLSLCMFEGKVNKFVRMAVI